MTKFSRDVLGGVILILAVVLAYQPMWRAGFIWDDQVYIVNNPYVKGVSGLKAIWTTSAADISPLTFTTFWLEHALWGSAPIPYHIVNVLLHGVCAVVLWRVLLRLEVPGAWLGAALWALHPVLAESVAWITETKNTQSGLCFLLSILFFLKGLKGRGPEKPSGRGWNQAFSLIFAALAMASKSSAVILPIVLCLCAWWMERRWSWQNLVRLGPMFLMSLATAAVSMWTQKLQLAGGSDSQWVRTWPQRLVTAGDAVWFYLGKLVWPHPLITGYPRWQIDGGRWTAYLPLLAVIVVLFIFWRNRETWSRPWFFVFAYFLAALLPILGLVDNYIFRYSLVFDHFQYLASMGPLALAGAAMARWADLVLPDRRRLQAILGAGVLLLFGLLSWQRAQAFQSEETLWTDTLSSVPNSWMAHSGLGAAFLNGDRDDEAIVQLQAALVINPRDVRSHCNLGHALYKKGRVDEALAQYAVTLTMNPNYPKAHYNLGAALLKMGREDEAIAQFQAALEIDPDDAEAHYNLGLALLQKREIDEALAEFQRALVSNPGYAEAHYNLGLVLFRAGRMDEGIVQLQKALEIKPGYADAHNNLGNALLQEGRLDEAISQYQSTLEIDPKDAQAHYNLGNALCKRGRLDEAVIQYQKTIETNPAMAEAHFNLGIIMAQMGRLDDAIAQFQDALQLKPGFVAAQNYLARAQALQKSVAPGK